MAEPCIVNRFTVPNLPDGEVIARATQGARETKCDPRLLERWKGFEREQRGKTFEVMQWRPGTRQYEHEVRYHFQADRFFANIAVFLAWIAQEGPQGWFTSIPPRDHQLLVRLGNGDFNWVVPTFVQTRPGRADLRLEEACQYWGRLWTHVAFREVS